MENLERTILGEFLLLDDYKKQVDVMLDLGEKYFDDEMAKKFIATFSKILFEKRSLVDQVGCYQDILKIEGIRATEFVELTSDITSTDKIFIHIQELKSRKYRNNVVKETELILSEMKNALSVSELDEKKDKMIVSLSGMDLDSESKFIEPKGIISKIEINLDKGRELEGHSWGLIELDSYTSGIVSPRLFVIGGLKKTGKSRFVLNTMIELYHNNIPTVFLSLEMPEYEVVKLLISRYAGIPETHLRNSSIISKDERIKFQQAKADIDWNLLNVECANRLNINQIVGRIRKYKKMFGNCVIFIDYLQRITHDRNRQAQELEMISVAIADATREYGCPIVLLSQLSNLAEREGVSVGALKGSGGIGEAADVILLLDNLYRKEKIDTNKNKMDVYIEQRYGDSGKITITTDLSWCKFADYIRFENSP